MEKRLLHHCEDENQKEEDDKMSIREEFDKLKDEAKEHIQDFEEKHDERVIAHRENKIKEEEYREEKHLDAIGFDEEKNQDWLTKEEEKFHEAELRHDKKVIDHEDEVITKEMKKIDEHEAKFYGDEANLEKVEAEAKKSQN